MINLYVLAFEVEGKNLFGGFSTNLDDFKDISAILERRPNAENFVIKIFPFDLSKLVKYREDMEHPIFWFKIDDYTSEIVGLEYSFEEMNRLNHKSGYRYVGETLTEEDMGMVYKKNKESEDMMATVSVKRVENEIVVTLETKDDSEDCYVEYEKLSEAKGYDWEGQFSGIFRFMTPIQRTIALRQIIDGLHSLEE